MQPLNTLETEGRPNQGDAGHDELSEVSTTRHRGFHPVPLTVHRKGNHFHFKYKETFVRVNSTD